MSRPNRPEVLLIALAALALTSACQRHETAGPSPSKPAPPPPAVLVAKRGTAILERGLDQPVWHGAAATAAFVDERRDRPVPHTEARASWDDRALFLTLYVADEDLHATDRVQIDLDQARTIEASPNRTLRCRFAAEGDCNALGVKADFDVDGDVDAPAEEDEEWSVTVEIPWSTLALIGRPAELPIAFRRHDDVKGTPLELVWSRGPGVIRLE